MNTPLQPLPETVEFRFFVDFVIKIQPKELGSFTEEQTTMLKAIVTSPATLRKIACMRLETDISGITNTHLSDLFVGPSDEEILETILPCLSSADRTYWQGLSEGPGDSLLQEIMPVFLAFEATVRRAGIEELHTEVKTIRKIVGSTVDSPN